MIRFPKYIKELTQFRWLNGHINFKLNNDLDSTKIYRAGTLGKKNYLINLFCVVSHVNSFFISFRLIRKCFGCLHSVLRFVAIEWFCGSMFLLFVIQFYTWHNSDIIIKYVFSMPNTLKAQTIFQSINMVFVHFPISFPLYCLL